VLGHGLRGISRGTSAAELRFCSCKSRLRLLPVGTSKTCSRHMQRPTCHVRFIMQIIHLRCLGVPLRYHHTERAREPESESARERDSARERAHRRSGPGTAMLGRRTWQMPNCTQICVDSQTATGPCQLLWSCGASTGPLPRLPPAVAQPQAVELAPRTARCKNLGWGNLAHDTTTTMPRVGFDPFSFFSWDGRSPVSHPVSSYVRRPFPSKENQRISERDDLRPPVVPGGQEIGLGSRNLEREDR
jgi:hypothetical protein